MDHHSQWLEQCKRMLWKAHPQPLPCLAGLANKEVKQWLKEIGLEKVCREEISEMNRQTLIDLQQLRGECPGYFYRCLEQNLNLGNMFDILKFRMELGKLLRY